MTFADTNTALTFMLAGNARITAVSKKTGTRYTYQIRQKENDFGKKTPHFVSVLTGPDNRSDYTYIGYISSTGDFMPGKKGKPGCPSYKAFNWMYNVLRSGHIHDDVEIMHENRCGRCSRPLTVPESIQNGIGPECAKKVFG